MTGPQKTSPAAGLVGATAAVASEPAPAPGSVDAAAAGLDTGGPTGSGPRRASFLSRLSTGTGAFDVLGPRRWYYIVSSVLVVASILLIVVRGFNFGIDFAGGTQLQFAPSAGTGISTSDVASTVSTATGVEPDAVQVVGNNLLISSSSLTPDQVTAAKAAITSTFAPTGGVSDSAVSETWGGEISQRALIAVIVFLIAVAIFLWIRYERRVAAGAVVSVLHDVVITAGIYSLIGFEVTPATVIGLLTILGFSLYDTVVVYDKVQENSKGLLSLTRRTYPEAANLAINQTLMRSINTSLIALLPVAGLLVAGVVLLGSGTLKDLSLVMLIGMLVGAYSSVFLAVPLAVDLKLRDPQVKAHTARIVAKRQADGLIVDADGDVVARTVGTGKAKARRGATRVGSPGGSTPTTAPVAGVALAERPAVDRPPAAPAPGAAPRPGVKPVRPGAGKRPAGKGGRPSGKRGR